MGSRLLVVIGCSHIQTQRHTVTNYITGAHLLCCLWATLIGRDYFNCLKLLHGCLLVTCGKVCNLQLWSYLGMQGSVSMWFPSCHKGFINSTMSYKKPFWNSLEVVTVSLYWVLLTFPVFMLWIFVPVGNAWHVINLLNLSTAIPLWIACMELRKL